MIYQAGRDPSNPFFSTLCTSRAVFAISRINDTLHLVRAKAWDAVAHIPGECRPVEPLKSVVFKPRETVAQLMTDSNGPAIQEQIVIGVKNCDLSALKIHDFVFLADPQDPFYKTTREKTIIVSCDCTDCLEVCFCTAVKEQPYAKAGFDINISPLAGSMLVESGSAKGEALLKSMGQILKPASDTQVQERDRKREEMTRKVESQAEAKGLKASDDLHKAVKKTVESDLWDDFAKNCVECGACNYTCCTCHCFLLADGTDDKKALARVRQWDSCLLKNFARVAGNANPRKHRAERLYNRFDKKFVFFPTVLKTYACDGCGRCVQACTGKIDIREVLKKALDEAR